METYYAQLAAALEERLAVIGDAQLRQERPDEHLRRLQAAAERIDALQAQLPSQADPRLRHYLERQSLTKALDFLRDHGLVVSSRR